MYKDQLWHATIAVCNPLEFEWLDVFTVSLVGN
jgi:hypothetical protein